MTDKQQERVSNGLCPRCGKPAAPYYYCSEHRFDASLGRVLRRGQKLGVFDSEKRPGDKRLNWWTIGPNELKPSDWRAQGSQLRDSDKRLRPRLKGIPVDVEKTLISMMRAIGKPLMIEEIEVAWGRLRTSRKHETVAGDLKALIVAQQRRERRLAKQWQDQQGLGAP